VSQSAPRLGGAVAAVLALATVAAAMTWPLARQVTTHLPDVQIACRFDAIFAAWTLAWETTALTSAPWTILDTNIFFPTTGTLFYGSTGFGALVLFAPVFLVTGNPILALNATFLGGAILTAVSLHLVVVHWTDRWLAGFVAGVAYLATRWVLWFWNPTAPQYAPLFWLPIIILLASTPAASFRRALWLAPLIALQSALDLVYVAPAVIAPIAVLAVVRIGRPATRAAGWRLAGALALALVMLAPLYAGLLAVRIDNPALREQTVWRVGDLPPTVPFPGIFLHGTYPTAVPAAGLALVLVGVWMRRRRRARGEPTVPAVAWRHAAYWTVAGLALATPPMVQLWGTSSPVLLPHGWLNAWVPIYGVIRSPERLGVVALIGLCLLIGIGFAECLRGVTVPAAHRLRSLALAAAVLAAIHVEYRRGLWAPDRMPLPRGYALMEPPALDDATAAVLASGAGPVLELPVAADGVLPGRHARAMYRSIFHHRPLLNGYSSYWPAGFPARMALASRLPDADALATLRGETGLATIVVQLDEVRDADRKAAWLAIPTSRRTDLVLRSHVGATMVFDVTPPVV
jgi:hypothetical protein